MDVQPHSYGFEVRSKVVGYRPYSEDNMATTITTTIAPKNILLYDLSPSEDIMKPGEKCRLVDICMVSKRPYIFSEISFFVDTGKEMTKMSSCTWDLLEILKEWGVVKDHPHILGVFQAIHPNALDLINQHEARMYPWDPIGSIIKIEDFVNIMPERPRRIEIKDPSDNFDLYVTYKFSK
jgi:hypothetical protein